MWGKEVSATLVRNEMKKRKKNITLLVCLRMQAMVAGRLGRLEGQSTVVGIMCGEVGF